MKYWQINQNKSIKRATGGFSKPSSVGAPKMKTRKRGTRASTAASGLMHAHRPKGGSLSLWNQLWKGGTALFYSYKEAHSCTLETLSQGRSPHTLITTAWYDTMIRQRWDYQTPVVLKIKATRASVKFCGATSTWVRLSHRCWINKNTAQHRCEGKGPKPCAQNKHVRSMCSLGLMLWWGFAWKCSPLTRHCKWCNYKT